MNARLSVKKVLPDNALSEKELETMLNEWGVNLEAFNTKTAMELKNVASSAYEDFMNSIRHGHIPPCHLNILFLVRIMQHNSPAFAPIIKAIFKQNPLLSPILPKSPVPKYMGGLLQDSQS
jgi:hypothetical protein